MGPYLEQNIEGFARGFVSGLAVGLVSSRSHKLPETLGIATLVEWGMNGISELAERASYNIGPHEEYIDDIGGILGFAAGHMLGGLVHRVYESRR